MEQVRPLIDCQEIIFKSLVRQHKNQGKFVVMKMCGKKEPIVHVLTHIAGKNKFIDTKMNDVKPHQLLFLIKHKNNAIYLVLSED